MNKIKSGFFGLIEIPEPDGHAFNNWWVRSSYIPENRALPGLDFGTHWAARKPHMEARLAIHPAYANVHYLVHYLMTEPVASHPLEDVLRDFVGVGGRARGLGLMNDVRTTCAAVHYRLLSTHVSSSLPISAEALPWRPNKGVFMVMQDVKDPAGWDELGDWYDVVHIPDMLTVKGVAGAYRYRSRGPMVAGVEGAGDASNRHAVQYYLDADPLEMVADLRAKLPQWRDAGRLKDLSEIAETVLAGPFESVRDPRHYDWHAA